MFLAEKVHVVSGIVIGALAVMAAKQMCKRRKAPKQSSMLANPAQKQLHGCCDKVNREAPKIALRRLRRQNNFENGVQAMAIQEWFDAMAAKDIDVVMATLHKDFLCVMNE